MGSSTLQYSQEEMMKAHAKSWEPPTTRLLVLLFLFVFSASFFDATSTLELHLTGNYYEVNPFARLALSVGDSYFLFWRVVSMGLMIGLITFLGRKYRIFWWCLLICVAVYTCITFYYFHHIFLFTP
jgi:hypothetical protein